LRKRLSDLVRGRLARLLDAVGILGLVHRLPEHRQVELVADLAIANLSRGSFREWEARGLHVTPVHYYQPVPDTRALPEDLWERRSPMTGVDLQVGEQPRWLERIATHREEYDALPAGPTGDPLQFHFGNQAFGPVDAEVLYGLVRVLRPRRVVEVGSGWSTRLIAQALRANAAEDPSHSCRFVTIDPTPDPVLGALAEVIPAGVQDADRALFAGLDRNDVLFIDSSHVAAIGSDVVLEILELLPSLRSGVIVHFHDIFLPAEYPRAWVMDHHRFWNEQYLLQAFLAYNAAFEVMLANSWLHLAHPEVLRRIFGRYVPGVLPGSFWLRRR
jgi:predicted O-methyltransferase YrrM